MEENTRQEKLEAVADICQYDRKIIAALKALNESVDAGQQIPAEWWDNVMQGINWTVEVLKRVMDVMEEGGIDKNKINDALTSFNSAYAKGDEKELSRVIALSLIPCIEHICTVGEKIAVTE